MQPVSVSYACIPRFHALLYLSLVYTSCSVSLQHLHASSMFLQVAAGAATWDASVTTVVFHHEVDPHAPAMSHKRTCTHAN